MEKCGRLVLKDVSLNVFKGSFSSDISDAEFRYLTAYLRTNLKIHLLEKQPEFIPVFSFNLCASSASNVPTEFLGASV